MLGDGEIFRRVWGVLDGVGRGRLLWLVLMDSDFGYGDFIFSVLGEDDFIIFFGSFFFFGFKYRIDVFFIEI